MCFLYVGLDSLAEIFMPRYMMFPESGVVDCWGRLLKSELIGRTVDLFWLMEKFHFFQRILSILFLI